VFVNRAQWVEWVEVAFEDVVDMADTLEPVNWRLSTS
jgi:hypothetical protein